MTYTLLYLSKISCDECDEERTTEVNEDYEMLEEVEADWFKRLKKEGWFYDRDNDMHYCPECHKELRQRGELKSNGNRG